MPYAPFWLSASQSFCGKIVPTVVSDARSTEVLSSVMYHFPRFWLKPLAPVNIWVMSVTDETFQPEMS